MTQRVSTYCLLVLVTTIAAGGCATHTGTGMLTGAGLGGLAGGIIGHQTGDTAAGAALGAGLGGIAGGVIGAGQDENDRRNENRIAAAEARLNAPGPVSIDEVIQMARSGVHESTIISTIRSSGAAFHLSPSDVVYLHNNGVSDRVITAMQQARRPVVRGTPAVVYERPVIVEPAPVVYVAPPPPRFSIGFGYCRPYRHCW